MIHTPVPIDINPPPLLSSNYETKDRPLSMMIQSNGVTPISSSVLNHNTSSATTTIPSTSSSTATATASLLNNTASGAITNPNFGANLLAPTLPPTFGRASSNINPPNLARNNSLGSRQQSVNPSTALSDWRSFVAIEERTAARKKMRDAYKKTAATYDELLDLVAAIDEELVFGGASGRLEYFKQALDYDGRLAIKRKQLNGHITVGGFDRPNHVPLAAPAPVVATTNSGANTSATSSTNNPFINIDLSSSPNAASASHSGDSDGSGGSNKQKRSDDNNLSNTNKKPRVAQRPNQ